MEHLYLVLIAAVSGAKFFCERTKMPLELGVWSKNLEHMDTAVVENEPVSISDGQVYVYENYFPSHVIRYISVDNLAKKSCGASVILQRGGVGASTVVIVLHANSHQEIRSVIDIWGSRLQRDEPAPQFSNMTSLYLFKKLRTVNHNV